jgi:hypothetical protein
MRKGERGMGNCGMGNADCGIFRRGIAEFEFRNPLNLTARKSRNPASKNSAIRNPNSAFPLEVITENIFQDETSI